MASIHRRSDSDQDTDEAAEERIDPHPPALENEEPARRVRFYVAFVAVAAATTACLLALSGFSLPPLWVVAVMGALAAAAERVQVRLTKNIAVSISLLPVLFVSVVYGPFGGMAVAALAMLGDFRHPYLRWALYTSAGAINGALAGLVAGQAETLTSSRPGATFFATVAAALSLQAFDLSIATVTLVVRRTMTAKAVLATALPIAPSSVLLNSALVGPLAYAFIEVSPWVLPFFLLPALAAQRLFVMYQVQRALADDLSLLNVRLEQANISFASALVATLDARDRYTAGHSAAVAIYARDIAARLGLSPELQRLAHLAGMVHDIGKIGVPPGILEKPGPLTLHERRMMEEHSVIGERILSNVEAYTEIARIVRHHHERIDGLGYPDGIKGEDIPLISRIICVADAYNAMTSDRPYRDAMPSMIARERLRQAAGSQFDTLVVAAFDAILDHATETYTVGACTDFDSEACAHPEPTGVVTATAA